MDKQTHFIAPNVEDNEILKRADFNLAGEAAMMNTALAIGTVVSSDDKACVIGGTVTLTNHTNTLRIAPIYMRSANRDVAAGAVRTSSNPVVEGTVTLSTQDKTGNDGAAGQSRRDVLYVTAEAVEEQLEQRAFSDPGTGDKTQRGVYVRHSIVPTLGVLVGAWHPLPNDGYKDASQAEALPDALLAAGAVKIAEAVIYADGVTEPTIYNITARGINEPINVNANWTADKESVFNPDYLSTVLQRLLLEHEDSGKHRERTITAQELMRDSSTGGNQDEVVNAGTIPLQRKVVIHNRTYPAISAISPNSAYNGGNKMAVRHSIADALEGLAEGVTDLYSYNSTLLRYSFNDAPIMCAIEKKSGLPISSDEEVSIDGVSICDGQCVLVTGDDAFYNGVYMRGNHAWTRCSADSLTSAKDFASYYGEHFFFDRHNGGVWYVDIDCVLCH